MRTPHSHVAQQERVVLETLLGMERASLVRHATRTGTA